MIRPPVYIAGPYGSPNALIRSWNVARACALARLAAHEGLAPICVHPGIAPTFGSVETPELRALGMAVDVALVELVARHPMGKLWILELDHDPPAGVPRGHHYLSKGTAAERRAWLRVRPVSIPGRRGTWADYRQAFQGRGLIRLWEALVQPPTSEDLAGWLDSMTPEQKAPEVCAAGGGKRIWDSTAQAWIFEFNGQTLTVTLGTFLDLGVNRTRVHVRQTLGATSDPMEWGS